MTENSSSQETGALENQREQERQQLRDVLDNPGQYKENPYFSKLHEVLTGQDDGRKILPSLRNFREELRQGGGVSDAINIPSDVSGILAEGTRYERSIEKPYDTLKANTREQCKNYAAAAILLLPQAALFGGMGACVAYKTPELKSVSGSLAALSAVAVAVSGYCAVNAYSNMSVRDAEGNIISGDSSQKDEAAKPILKSQVEERSESLTKSPARRFVDSVVSGSGRQSQHLQSQVNGVSIV